MGKQSALIAIVPKKICMGVSSWTGKKCEAKAVTDRTLKSNSKEFMDSRFCSMHQPDKKSRKKCVCPHCNYHRSKDVFPMIEGDNKVITKKENFTKELIETNEHQFGRSKKFK